ncbi:MAG: hypothetical protein ACXWPM_06955 [Bdellovibrionota bacterium]
MAHLIHKSPSVGSVIKKVLAVNPDLGVTEIIELIKQSIAPQGDEAGEFATSEVVDEEKALRLARETLSR